MALALVIVFIVVPLVELYVIIQVGGAIGVLPTIALLLLDSILGAMLWRAQGRAAWLRFNQALAERRIPAREVFDGALIIFGGALLLTPGFVTDIFGLLLLIPPTRALARRLLATVFAGRLARGGRAVFWTVTGPGAHAGADPGMPPGARPRPASNGGPRPYDFEGTGHEVSDQAPELPPGPGDG